MDLYDYISDGLVGKYNTGSVDIYDHDWGHAWSTNRSCRDAHQKAVSEFALSARACFLDNNNESQPNPSIGINTLGISRYCEAVNNTWDKYIQYFINSSIFFNTLQYDNGDPETSDKFKEIVTIQLDFYYQNPELWGTAAGREPTLVPITIDYLNNQTLNEQIYTNMITSLMDYLHALKNMIKVLTGTTFDVTKV